PSAQTLRKPGVSFEEVIENIDIGGPSMLRAAAKNFQDVAVVTSPDDYAATLTALREGNGVLPENALFELARKAFLLTARYDTQIAEALAWIEKPADKHAPATARPEFPPRVFLELEKLADMRYGENPHQQAAFYGWGGRAASGLAAARQLQGKELSYNNIVDLDAAWGLVNEFDEPAAAIIKHTNPCGMAIAGTLVEAYLKAYETDTVSAFGSIIAFNRPVDPATATEVAKLFVEAIAAPSFEEAALAILTTKKNLRLLAMGAAEESPSAGRGFQIRHVLGGALAQTPDDAALPKEARAVTKRAATPEEQRNLEFAWRVVKHVKSNAIVIAANGRAIGVGAGQMSRVDATKLAVQKAGAGAHGAVLASDAFFPFRDGIDEAAAAGVTAIIQPGGSVRDNETIEAADTHGVAMIFTGMRHFRH
ncbi:MAG TPA: bifunctional phosphoribosylaminoimidazolecarboxamide formyltransferase/IMP cyclohydrolase, partial [Terriglobia bacterium]|nr:bifunctional phosphoribosylaminoimidazolecarboxamide formyltransferase/IMP cyclohydrolase [Terriglobia bacterium]